MSTSLLLAILKSLRPLQWLKNIVLFAPLVFSGLLFSINPIHDLPYFVLVIYAAIIFSILASSIYLLNDIIDYKADRSHPFKKKRPIASGQLSIKLAFSLSMLGIIIVFCLSYPLGRFFVFLVFAYLALQILYSIKLKHIPIMDVFAIATAFVIRVYAGATVGSIHLNSWFLLTVISAALFIAVGKRQSERTLLSELPNLGATRITLKRYSQRLLDQYTSIFATATWLSYALFTFQYQFIRPAQNLSTLYPDLPPMLRPEKLLMTTIPLTIFGIMRYLQLIYESNAGESPAKVLVKDKVLLTVVLVLIGMVIAIIYYSPEVYALVSWLTGKSVK
jgi:4-hydroxybenzoate polyprenyltransferase